MEPYLVTARVSGRARHPCDITFTIGTHEVSQIARVESLAPPAPGSPTSDQLRQFESARPQTKALPQIGAAGRYEMKAVALGVYASAVARYSWPHEPGRASWWSKSRYGTSIAAPGLEPKRRRYKPDQSWCRKSSEATEAPGLINRWIVPDARIVAATQGTRKESSTSTSRHKETAIGCFPDGGNLNIRR